MEDRKIDFDMQTSDEHIKKASTGYKDKRKDKKGGSKPSRRGKSSKSQSKTKPNSKPKPKAGRTAKSKNRR